MRKKLFHRVVHRRTKAPAKKEAALTGGRGELGVGHQLRFRPAVPDEDPRVAGEHQVLEVAGHRLFHVDRGAAFLETVAEDVGAHGGDPHHVGAAVLHAFAAQVEPLAGELDDDGENMVVKPLEFLAIKVIDLRPKPVHEGDQLGGLHPGQVVEPHVGVA